MQSPTDLSASTIPWKAVLLSLLLAEALLFAVFFPVRQLAAVMGKWPEEPGLQLLAAVSFTVACAALVVGRSRRQRQGFENLALSLRGVGWLPLLLVQALLFLGLACLTARIQDGGPVYWDNRLRYATAWLLLAAAMLAVSLAPLLPERWRLLLLRDGVEPLTAVALAGAIVCVGLLAKPLWYYLNESSIGTVRAVLSRLTPEVVYLPDSAELGTPSFSVQIDCTCGGYAGIGLILIFLAVYFWLFRHDLRFPAVYLLFPLGVGLMWLSNVLRLTTMILLGTWKTPGVSVDGFHLQAGWLAFLSVSLGLTVLSRRSRLFAEDEAPALLNASARATLAYLSPLLILVTVMMVSPVFAGAVDWFYPLRVVAVAAALWFCRRYYTDLRWTGSWQAVVVGGGVFLLWIALEPPPSEAGGALETAVKGLHPGWAAVWLGFRVIGSVVTVPLAEELAFRGYLIRLLSGGDFQRVAPGRFTTFACLASSVLFGAMHGRFLAGTLAGLAFALALRRRGELADAVLAHAVTNGMLAAYVLMTGSWGLWM